MSMSLVLNQFEGSGITPSHTGRAGWDAAEVAFQGKPGLCLNEKGLFRAGSPADQTHIIRAIINHELMLGGTGCIHKWSGDSGEIGVAFTEHPDAGPSWIGYAGHMVQGARDLAMSATGAFGMINPDLWHP
jgi:hypothetical protein